MKLKIGAFQSQYFCGRHSKGECSSHLLSSEYTCGYMCESICGYTFEFTCVSYFADCKFVCVGVFVSLQLGVTIVVGILWVY